MDEYVVLAPFTSVRVGGAARFFCEPSTVLQVQEALAWARESSLRVWVLGGGTNTLISDAGYDGLVIHPLLQEWGIDEGGIHAGAGVKTSQLAIELARRGYRGFEWAATLPGTIGGALFGNAGCYGASMGDCVVSVEAVDMRTGALMTFSRDMCDYQYRMSLFKVNPESFLIVGCTMQMEAGDSADAMKMIRGLLKQRSMTQPQGLNSGCFFENPRGGITPSVAAALGMPSPATSCSAGLMIDRAGLKNVCCGGAYVSELHGNFLMNDGYATAEDFEQLIKIIKCKVRDTYQVELHEEIRRCA